DIARLPRVHENALPRIPVVHEVGAEKLPRDLIVARRLEGVDEAAQYLLARVPRGRAVDHELCSARLLLADLIADDDGARRGDSDAGAEQNGDDGCGCCRGEHPSPRLRADDHGATSSGMPSSVAGSLSGGRPTGDSPISAPRSRGRVTLKHEPSPGSDHTSIVPS